jgi:hypothetical protein
MAPYSVWRARRAGPGARPAVARNASIPSAADASRPSSAASGPAASGKVSRYSVRQRVRYRQPGDPGAHHQHALGLPGQPSGDVRPPIIEAPSGQPGHPLVGERPRYQRDVQRHPAD